MKDVFARLKQRKAHFYDNLLAGRFAGWPSYGFAVLGTAIAYGLRLGLSPFLGSQAPYAIFVPVILVSAAAGGGGPGLVAAALAALMALKLGGTAPKSHAISSFIIFLVVGTFIAGMGKSLHRIGKTASLAKDQLSSREDQIRSILQTSPDSAIVIDGTGLIISFNSAAERQFGYAEAEILGQNIKRLMPQPYQGTHDAYLERYRQTGEKRIIGKGRVVAAQRRDGSTFPIMLSVGEIRSGDTVYYTGFIRDLTERADAQAQMEQLHSELARLSRINEMGEMASTLAHELNQPLSAIANYVQGCVRMLRDQTDSLSVSVRSALEEAAKQSLRAGRIIHHLREAATHGITEMKSESLRSVIEEAAALALAGWREKGIKAVFDYGTAADTVFIDRVQIQQVLINLMRNAGEAMTHSQVKILTLSTLTAEDGMVAVEISDTGSGISPDLANQLFQPFVSGKPGGMGIGLTISKRIIEAHDGQISLRENAKGGVTFTFTLPLAESLGDGPSHTHEEAQSAHTDASQTEQTRPTEVLPIRDLSNENAAGKDLSAASGQAL